MVIIRTSATEVSIQAVSPEFGVQFICILASQAGAGSEAAAGSAGAGSWAWTQVAANNWAPTKTAMRSPKMRTAGLQRVGPLVVIVITPVRRRSVPGARSRRCGFSQMIEFHHER